VISSHCPGESSANWTAVLPGGQAGDRHLSAGGDGVRRRPFEASHADGLRGPTGRQSGPSVRTGRLAVLEICRLNTLSASSRSRGLTALFAEHDDARDRGPCASFASAAAFCSVAASVATSVTRAADSPARRTPATRCARRPRSPTPSRVRPPGDR
jgi:hypothetical protein